MTPSIYDETAIITGPNSVPLTGVNGALGKCADMVRKWSAEYKTGLADFNGLMNSTNLREQARDGKWSITGAGKNWNDRVHPGPVGNFIMAYALLKAQSVSPCVARISVDALKSKADEAVNCRVENVSGNSGGVQFDCMENGLPLVLPEECREVTNLVPFAQELNEEVLSVKGLAAGDYDLKIDGQPVGRFSAADLLGGINLAANERTPQYRQSFQVTGLIEKVRRAGENLREIATCRYGIAKRGENGMDPANYERVVRAQYEKEKAAGRVSSWVAVQFKEVESPGTLKNEYDGVVDQIGKACIPQKHYFALLKSGR